MNNNGYDFRRWDMSEADRRRKRIFAGRLKAARRSLDLRQEDLEKFEPELSWGRIRQWEQPEKLDAKPRADGFLVLSRFFGYPYEYFWPWLPEDGRKNFDVEEFWMEHDRLAVKVRSGEATQQERERYQQLLQIASRMVAAQPTTVQRPPLHLVCVISTLPSSPLSLPGVDDAWDAAWVLHVPGAEINEQVYAFELPIDCGMPAGTTVIFRPIFDGRPSRERWTIGNRRGSPVVFRGNAPDQTTILGEVLLAQYGPKM